MVNAISLNMLFSTHTMLTADMDTDQSVWGPQRRRFFPMLKVWRRWLDLFSFVNAQMVGYSVWHWGGVASPRRSAPVFVTQAFHFDVAIYLILMILPGNISQKLSADHTSGALDQRTAGFIAMFVSVASISWMYYNAFHFINLDTVNQWHNDCRETLSTWLVVTITAVVITLAMSKTPIVRQGLKYIIFEYMAFIFSRLESLPYFGAIFCDLAGNFRRRARPHLFEFQDAD